MKKMVLSVMSIILSLLCVVSLVGCQWFWGGRDVKKLAEKARMELSETVIDFIKVENKEGIKSILCPKTQAIADIEKQIELVFEFIIGKIVSYDIASEMSYEGEGTTNGVVDEYDFGWNIYNITTDEGITYTIYFHMFYLIADKTREGVTSFCVDNGNDSVNVGYRWNSSYQFDSGCLAAYAIQASSNGDLNALEELFCAESIKNIDIENQMRATFDFFEGSATFGKITNWHGGTHIDETHNFYNTKLDDQVVIENNEPASIYIEVFTVNIVTDSGRIYCMEWCAYLLNNVEPTLKGILQIKIINGNDNCIIGERLY